MKRPERNPERSRVSSRGTAGVTELLPLVGRETGTARVRFETVADRLVPAERDPER